MTQEVPPVHPFTPSRPVKRPRDYDEEIGFQICVKLGDGAKLHEICAEEGMPHAATVYRWRVTNPDFGTFYECALLARFDLKCGEMEEIAADGSNDFKLQEGLSEGSVPTVQPNPEAIGRSRLRIETLKWIAAKELPRKYGDPKVAQIAPNAPAAPQDANQPPPQEGKVVSIRAAMDASTRGTAVAATK